MKMKKALAAITAAVMALSAAALPASAYSIRNGAYIADCYAKFDSVDELADYLAEHEEGLLLCPKYDYYNLEIETEALWIPAGFSEYDIDLIYFCSEYTSVRFPFQDGDYTFYDYGTGAEGRNLYSFMKTSGDKQKVNGRTVYRRGSEYCWKQAGRYFMLYAGDGGAFKYCNAEEYVIPEHEQEGLTYIDGKKYYMLSDGSYYVGWLTLDDKDYFFGMDGSALTKNTTIGNVRYTFEKNGVCTGKYTGWLTTNGNRYYFKNGRYVTGVYNIKGKSYTFSKKGVLLSYYENDL